MHVLLSIDINDHAEAVLADATPWLSRLGATCDLIYVQNYADVNPYIHDPVLAEAVSKQWDTIRHQEQGKLEALLQTLPQANRGHAFVLQGDPASCIIDKLEGYDGLIIGTHGRTGLARAWMGSVAEKVARKAHVPVMILPIEV